MWKEMYFSIYILVIRGHLLYLLKVSQYIGPQATIINHLFSFTDLWRGKKKIIGENNREKGCLENFQEDLTDTILD